ncbi:antistasin-like [Pomacea canaliculata]|uniref:antistasin-like n=1 Tax=Pomacea canaliculata TaxID=400727 RepID=UPI000D73FC75|nr:antistasin-like [Pomacea canaliculata]
MASTSFLLLLLGGLSIIQGLTALILKPPTHECPPQCKIFCEYGFVLDSYGCPTCQCKQRPDCPFLKCPAIDCPYGRLEENGCPTCRCKPRVVDPPPGKHCPPVCLIFCPYGNVLDSNGCPICKCRDRPVCPPVRCPRPCTNGYVTKNGCQTCTCLPDVCRDKCSQHCANPSYALPPGCTCKCPIVAYYGMVSALLVFVSLIVGEAGAAVAHPPFDQCGPVCAIACLYGNVPDERGCPTCQCREKPLCPLFKCHACANGYVYVDGCQTCTCQPDCVPAVCPTIKCAYGLQRDENGCEICSCNPGPVCKLVRCRNACPYGYLYLNGCQTCTCRPRPECPMIKCARNCPSGYVYSKGCQTCTCLNVFQ